MVRSGGQDMMAKGGSSKVNDDVFVSHQFLNSFQSALGLPRAPSVPELEAALAGPESRADSRILNPMEPCALLDWVQIQLVEFLRSDINEVGRCGFPEPTNALMYPELARQLLMVMQVDTLAALRREEEGEEAAVDLFVKLVTWMRPQRHVDWLNMVHFPSKGVQMFQKAAEEDEEGEAKGGGDHMVEGDGERPVPTEKDGASSTSATQPPAGGVVTALDQEVKAAVWRAFLAWAWRHKAAVLEEVIDPTARRRPGRRRKKIGTTMMGPGSAPAPRKRQRTELWGAQLPHAAGREYMQGLFTYLKGFKDKELPFRWGDHVLSLLDTFHPLHIRQAVYRAATELRGEADVGQVLTREELLSCLLEEEPVRCKESAMRCLATALRALAASGYQFQPKNGGPSQAGQASAPIASSPAPSVSTERAAGPPMAPSSSSSSSSGGGGADASAPPPPQPQRIILKVSAPARAPSAKKIMLRLPSPKAAPPSPSPSSLPLSELAASTLPSSELPPRRPRQALRLRSPAPSGGGKLEAASSSSGAEDVGPSSSANAERASVSRPAPPVSSEAMEVEGEATTKKQQGGGSAGSASEAAPSTGTTTDEKKTSKARHLMKDNCKAVIRSLAQDATFQPFFIPVNEEVYQDYRLLVRRPMDLRSIDRKITSGRYGMNTQAVRKDVVLIKENAYAYNKGVNESVCRLADQLLRSFDKLLKAWVTDVSKGVSQGPSEEDFYLPAPWGEGCQVCRNDVDENLTLLCEGCWAEYHTYCLDPPLEALPAEEEDWFCPRCSGPRRALGEEEEDEDKDLEGVGTGPGAGSKGGAGDDQQEQQRPKGAATFGDLLDVGAQRLAALDKVPDLSRLGLTVIKSFGESRGLLEGGIIDYDEETGYVAVYPGDGDDENLSPEELERVRSESREWAARADRLLLPRGVESRQQQQQQGYNDNEEEGEGQGEEGEGRSAAGRRRRRSGKGSNDVAKQEVGEQPQQEDPFGANGCVMAALHHLRVSNYYDLSLQAKATILRALCEVAATTRALRNAFIAEEGATRNVGAEVLLPRYEALACDKRGRYYWSLVPNPDSDSRLVACRDESGAWQWYDPSIEEDKEEIEEAFRTSQAQGRVTITKADNKRLQMVLSSCDDDDEEEEQAAGGGGGPSRSSIGRSGTIPTCKLLRIAAKGYEVKVEETRCPVCPSNCMMRQAPHASHKKPVRIAGGTYISALRVALLELLNLVPVQHLEGGPLASKLMRNIWVEFVSAALQPEWILQGLTILEHSLPRSCLAVWWHRDWASSATATRSATYQSVAFRIFTLRLALTCRPPVK